MKMIFRNAWLEVKRRKSTFLWNFLGYVTAVAFLILTLTVTGFSTLGTTDALRYTGAQFVGFMYATPGDTLVRFKNPEQEGFFIFNNPVCLFPEQLIDEIRKSPNVKHAAPLLAFSMITDPYVNRSWIIAGFDPDDMESVRMVGCSGTEITEGRLIRSGDSGVVLLEQTFADAERYYVGDQIFISDREFTVAGILSPGTRPAKADIYLPLNDATGILNGRLETPVKDAVNVVLVDGASSLVNSKAMKEVKEILGFNSSVVGYGCFNPAGTAIGITTRGMKLLGLIVFMTILLLIGASQYFAVLERSNDIGILKAIGWSDRTVVSQILAETLILSVPGALTGAGTAVLLNLVFPVEKWFGSAGPFSLPVQPGTVALSILLTILAASLAGSLSAVMSVRLKPADILRRL